MNIDAKAREIVNSREVWRISEIRIPELEAIIAAALLSIRNEALEEAAKVADARGNSIATSIRALRRP